MQLKWTVTSITMLNTFDQSSKAASRRAERERQLELMNHAANGTGPFAAEAMDSNWDVADIDIGDLDIDQSLALDVSVTSDGSHPMNTTLASHPSSSNALDPERARAAASSIANGRPSSF